MMCLFWIIEVLLRSEQKNAMSQRRAAFPLKGVILKTCFLYFFLCFSSTYRRNGFICPKDRYYQLTQGSPMLWLVMVMHKAGNFIKSSIQHCVLSCKNYAVGFTQINFVTISEFADLKALDSASL